MLGALDGEEAHSHTTQSPAPPQHCGCLSLDCHRVKTPGLWWGSRGCTSIADLSFELTSAFWDGPGVFLCTDLIPHV